MWVEKRLRRRCVFTWLFQTWTCWSASTRVRPAAPARWRRTTSLPWGERRSTAFTPTATSWSTSCPDTRMPSGVSGRRRRRARAGWVLDWKRTRPSAPSSLLPAAASTPTSQRNNGDIVFFFPPSCCAKNRSTPPPPPLPSQFTRGPVACL